MLPSKNQLNIEETVMQEIRYRKVIRYIEKQIAKGKKYLLTNQKLVI
jgi:hypothetical protein